MKFIAAMISLLSLAAFAGTHNPPAHKASCGANESCLIHLNYSEVIKNVTMKNMQLGNSVETPNIDGNLSDTVFAGAQLCYQGRAAEVCRVLQKLAERERGGSTPSKVSKFFCGIRGDKINLLYSVQYDVGAPDNMKFMIGRCR